MSAYQPQLPLTQLTISMMPLSACWLLGVFWCGAWERLKRVNHA